MHKINLFYLKIKLINLEIFFYIFFSRLYKFSKLILFKKLSIINARKFKSLPKHYLYFEKINNIVENKLEIIDYKNKKILEIGGGNFWGLLPFFAKFGSKKYTNIDIALDQRIIKSNFVWNKFLKKNSSYLSSKIINKIECSNYECQIENFNNQDKFDRVVSVSCLEHIKDIDSFFKSIKKYTNSNSIHLHLVNFSNHLNEKHPFNYIYTLDKNKFLKDYNVSINLLRLNDYEIILQNHNFDFEVIILKKKSIRNLKINDFWLNNYSLDQLEVHSALIIVKGYKI